MEVGEDSEMITPGKVFMIFMIILIAMVAFGSIVEELDK